MNTKSKIFIALLSVCIATLLYSCGGSGSSSGQSGSTNTFGTITALGSITVNGVKFETTGAQVTLGDTLAPDDSGLSIGMVTEVQGTVNDDGITGTADVVSVPTQVEGPITNIDETIAGLVKKITVMGQTVLIETGTTVFDNDDPTFTFASIALGNVVSANGFLRDDGVLATTFIEKKAADLATFIAAGNDLEVTGKIANLDLINSTFTINALTVDFATVTIEDLENATGGILANGLVLEVHGTNFTASTLVATRVEVKINGLTLNNAIKAEMEGFITDLDTAAETFKINGQSINYANAIFKAGLKAELTDGIKVEAEGPMVAGIIVATKVAFKASMKMEGNVATVDALAGTITVEGLTGIVITVDNLLTRFKNALSLNDISVGNNLKIRARKSGSSGTILMATRITLENAAPSTRLILQGAVESFDATGDLITILGIPVDTSGILDTNFEGEDITLGKATFFNLLTVGTLVKAKAELGPPLVWDKIELEDED